MQTLLKLYAIPCFCLAFFAMITLRPCSFAVSSKHANDPANATGPSKPSYLVHVSGLNFSPENSKHATKLELLFRNLSQLIKPEAVIITGGVTNSISTLYSNISCGQFEENWTLFFDATQNVRVIASASNRDVSMITSPGSDEDLYTKYINNGNASQFLIRSHFVNLGGRRVRVVVFNPYVFPVPPMPLGLFPSPTREMLDVLEQELVRGSADEVVLACSHPLQSIKTMESIITRTNVRYYLSSNFYGRSYSYHRVHETLEAVSVPPIDKNRIGIISNDNGVWTYSFCDLDEDYVYVLSFPPPRDQFFERNPYVSRTFRVNFVVFETHPLTLAVSLDGIELGRMKADITTDTYTIYGFDISTSEGVHVLLIDGDITIQREFVVGPDLPKSHDKGLPFFAHRHTFIAFVAITHAIILLQFVFTPQFSLFGFYISILLLPVYFIKGREGMGIVWPWGFSFNLEFVLDLYPIFLSALESILVVYPLLRSITYPFFWTAPLACHILMLTILYRGSGISALLTSPWLYVHLPWLIFNRASFTQPPLVVASPVPRRSTL